MIPGVHDHAAVVPSTILGRAAGCYLYEPGGSVHQFNTPADNTEDTDTFMIVTGANVNFDKDSGSYINMMDAGMIKTWVDQGIAEQGADKMQYITAPVPTYAGNK